jgi:hypothetical protein
MFCCCITLNDGIIPGDEMHSFHSAQALHYSFQVKALVVYQEAYQLAMKEHSTLPSNPATLQPKCGQVDVGCTLLPPPTRDQLLDEELFLGQLLRVASVLNPGFQAAVLERICDHLFASLPDGSLQGGLAEADDFFRDWDLFHTECICVDPAVDPSQPAQVAATASLCWQDVARPQAENPAGTLMAGGTPVFSRARSAGQDVRPRLVGPEPQWPAQSTPLGFTRSRSAADKEEEAAAAAAGRSVSRGWDAWDVGGVFTRSRYQMF